ncbi:MAG TPA: NAD(P)/FAD-dependent oxidoreductase, partial [Candidatus Acidoferrum sp.]|nr:NAD(P)/FAD-dependent oxidoreductase [Candidatus Acidoferrum sp.]
RYYFMGFMNGNVEQVETVITGGGHAGLTMSYFLSQRGLEHVVLERGRVGERWISERWDSFHFQFPNSTIELPGYKYQTDDPDGFVPGREIVRFIQEYADYIKAPVRCGVNVIALESLVNSMSYLLRTNAGAIEARNVVIATGSREKGIIPRLNSGVPNDIRQLHSSGYRNAGELPAGAVLVVGSGASGFQIAEDLHQYGRQVYLCVGRHRPLARRYRGRDYALWAMEMGMFERRRAESPATSAPGPLLTGVNGGYQADVRALASKGIVLLGRLKAVTGSRLALAPDLEENLTKGEEWLVNYKKSVDDYIAKNKLNIPEESPPNLSPIQKTSASTPILELDLRIAGITSIIWATGFGNEYDWLKVPVLDERREPLHERGVTQFPGIYFLGLRWLYKQKSGFLSFGGPAEDADYLAEQIAARHNGSPTRSS